MRRATPEQAKQAREAYAKHQQLVGELAEKLGGAEAREALVVGRNAVVRKWYIQHLDARQFWEAVLAVLGAEATQFGHVSSGAWKSGAVLFNASHCDYEGVMAAARARGRRSSCPTPRRRVPSARSTIAPR